MISNFPKQRLPYSKKVANNNEWGKNMIDHLVLNYAATSYHQGARNSEYHRMLSNYQLYNNVINQEDFESTFNPMGISAGQFKDDIQPYNKCYNKIQVLLGDELSRPFDYRIVLQSSTGVESKMQRKNELLKAFIQNEINQVMQQAQQQGIQIDEQIIPPEQLDEYMNTTYMDAREKLARQIFEYLWRSNRIKEIMNDAFKHALISGYEFLWVGTDGGEPVVYPLNPLGVIYHKSPEIKYIEDGLYAGYRTMMNSGDIVDKYGEYLDAKDLRRIEGTMSGIKGMDSDIISSKMKYYTEDVYDHYLQMENTINPDEGSYGRSFYGDWVVSHLEWRSEKKVGFISFINEYGEPQEDIVNEDFKVPDYAETQTTTDPITGIKRTTYNFDGFTLYWGWLPEVWEGLRIGDDIYAYIRPKQQQFRDIDNPFSVKLGYHGASMSNMNAPTISLMDRMKPFQYLYLIIMHKLKKLIAKDRGKVYHFDVTMVPDNMPIQKVMYYLEEMDIDFFNPLMNAEKPGAFQRGKIATSTDRSNMQHILNYVQLLDAIDFQLSDVAGVNRQREGQVTSTEAVTNAQMNINQSTIITEAAYFYPHYQIWERALNSLVHCAQQAWKDKSVARQYVLDDLTMQTLKMVPGQLDNEKLGLFVSNTQKDNEAFNAIKQYMLALIQNDKASFTDLVKVFKAKSIGELEQISEQAQKNIQQSQIEQIRAQQESQQAQIQAQFQMEELKGDIQSRIQAEDNIAELERLILELEAQQQTESTKVALEKARLKLDEKIAEMKHQVDMKKASQPKASSK